MPYSKKQLRWANSPSGVAALGKSKVAEWNDQAPGLQLPETSNGGAQALKHRLRKRKRLSGLKELNQRLKGL